MHAPVGTESIAVQRYFVSFSMVGCGHGRFARCTMKAAEVAEELGAPHANQVLQVRRTGTWLGRRSVEFVYMI